MSRWTHAICTDCWKKREPDKEPTKVFESMDEKCCFCGRLTGSGIYVREDPGKTQCRGIHPEGS